MDPFQSTGLFSGIGGLLGGLFGNSGQPYSDAAKQYQQWANQAATTQQPFLQGGKVGLGNFQQWLSGMKNPSDFINNLMTEYHESPWAHYQQQQALRAGQNAASALGLSGSTPFAQQLQQTSTNISNQDLNQWLQNVLGINTQYGTGNQSLMNQGASSANALTNLYNMMGQNLGELAYGQRAGQNQDFWNMLGGGLNLGRFFF